MEYWQLNQQQIRSFLDWNPTFESIAGPRCLLSFSSRDDRIDGPPMYWLEKQTVINCMEKARQENDLESFYEFIRQGVALREDWGNSLMWAFEISIEEKYSVNAWVGQAKAQQSAMKAGRLQQRAKDGLSLIFWGGFQQYLINQRDCRILSMISKPFLTQSLFELNHSANIS